MESRIGVALCTYNGAPYIEQQVDSIVDQSPRPDQLVIADDGSKDSTVELGRGSAERGAVPVRVLMAAKPLGVTLNFQRAVTALSTDLIALSDQDDVWHPGRLAAFAAQFEADPALMLLHSDARLVDADGRPLGLSLFDSLEVGEAELAAEDGGRAFDVLVRRNIVTGATVMFRRSLLDYALPFPPEWVHDEWLAIVASAVGRVSVLREQLTDYRQHGGNAIGVEAPTLRHKVGRVLEPRGQRNVLLATRSAILARRLAELGDVVAPEVAAAAEEKASFELARADLPANRLRRAPRVLRLAFSGLYPRFASRGNADIVRDILQPA